MQHIKGLLLPSIIFLLLFSQSCANYKLQYDKQASNWEQQTQLPQESVSHTVYLIGDAGGGRGPALTLLEKKLKQTSSESTVVFLGDNVYPNGLGPEEAEDRAADEERLNAQLDILEGYDGQVYFIAGNHDWNKYGLEGVKRQKKYIESYLDRDDLFYPKPGCGEPKEIDLSDNLVLVLIDSEWYLQDWNKEYKVNAGCEVKSRAVFQEYVEEAIKGNRNKNVIVAMHHPPYTNGPHGGNFTLKQHIFPLTDLNKNLYFPLPVLGTGLQLLRGTVGHKQDAIHPQYRELAGIVIDAARKNGHFVIASGHEHCLQFMENDGQFFVGSGSGSKQHAAKLGNNADFVYGNQGFSEILYYKDGSSWIQFWAAYEEGEGKLIYRKKLTDGLPDIIAVDTSTYEAYPDSITIPVSEERFDKGALWSLFWGKHYRAAYKAEIAVPTLNLESFKDGVLPVKRGGGYQTNSLRLEAENERQYVMRSIDKDATRTIGYPFTESFVTTVVKDNFSASHPMAAMAVSVLAKEAGVYHTYPKLYYVPKQQNLGIYNDDFGNALYLVEERPDDDLWKKAKNFGKPDDVIGTLDMVDEILEEHDEVVDYQWVVKSRLFDAFIGDWDRHDDQWRWAEFKRKGVDYYRPIPRDRDQAFSNYDGFIISLIKSASPGIKRLLTYKEKVNNIKWLIYNGRHFDRTFLSGASWEMWEEEAKALQMALTDEVIESAFKEEWPSTLYELDGKKLSEITKKRRDNIPEIAKDYYNYISRKVDVVGTQEKDYFLIEQQQNGAVHIRVFGESKKDSIKYFDRTFYPNETREVILYGLKKDDTFHIKGKPKGKAIKIRIVGGLGEDNLKDESGGRNIAYYDAKNEETIIDETSKAKLYLKNSALHNTYNRESKDYEFNYVTALPSLSFNPDDGILLGAYGQYTKYGFKKEPYAAQHEIIAFYALETGGVMANLNSEFTDVVGSWELGYNINYQSPLYSINYYGLGNDTDNPELANDDDDDLRDFNRIKQRVVSVSAGLLKRLNNNSLFAIGPTFESVRVERTPGRFIDEVGDDFNPEVFEGLEFVGGSLLFSFNNADHNTIPARGMGVEIDAGWKQNLDDTDRDYAYVNAKLSLYQHLDRKRRLVAASQLGFQHRFSDDFEFYQAASLGGPGPDANFRGFRRNRFTGTTAFWQNIDLRWKMLTSANPTIPFSLGLLAGFDHGRVWYQEEGAKDESNTWHYSYGGGIWLSPFDLFALNFSLFRGDNEQNLVIIGGGFFF